MEKLIKISSSILPDIYPVISYIDRKFTTNRPIRMGYRQEIYETSAKYATVADAWKKERTIQAILYDKYQFQLSSKEHNSIDLLRFADTVTLEQLDTGEVHNVNIIDISSAKVGATQNLMYTITYFDTNPLNYKDYQQPANSLLERTSLLARFTTVQLVGLTLYRKRGDLLESGSISEASSYTFYTCLLPDRMTTDSSVKSTEVDGLIINTKITNQTGYSLKFYCKEDEMNLMKKFLPQCGTSSGVNEGLLTADTKYYMRVKIEGITFEILEAANPEVKEIDGLIGLYECSVFVKTESTNNPSFE